MFFTNRAYTKHQDIHDQESFKKSGFLYSALQSPITTVTFVVRLSPKGKHRASSPRADWEASRERLGAEVRKRELATITEEISFPLPLREGEYHWLKNDKLSINNHWQGDLWLRRCEIFFFLNLRCGFCLLWNRTSKSLRINLSLTGGQQAKSNISPRKATQG